jgi:hypothetical protein
MGILLRELLLSYECEGGITPTRTKLDLTLCLASHAKKNYEATHYRSWVQVHL